MVKCGYEITYRCRDCKRAFEFNSKHERRGFSCECGGKLKGDNKLFHDLKKVSEKVTQYHRDTENRYQKSGNGYKKRIE